MHVAPIAPGKLVNGGAHLPFVSRQAPWFVFVSTIVVASMVARAVITPTVVHNNSVLEEGNTTQQEECFVLDVPVCLYPSQVTSGI